MNDIRSTGRGLTVAVAMHGHDMSVSFVSGSLNISTVEIINQ
jgi:hypothetical protein